MRIAKCGLCAVDIAQRQANFAQHAAGIPLAVGPDLSQLLSSSPDLELGVYQLTSVGEDFTAMQSAQRRIAIGSVTLTPTLEFVCPLTGAVVVAEVQVRPDYGAEHDAAHPRPSAAGERRRARFVVRDETTPHLASSEQNVTVVDEA